jgi:hypothetical protein
MLWHGAASTSGQAVRVDASRCPERPAGGRCVAFRLCRCVFQVRHLSKVIFYVSAERLFRCHPAREMAELAPRAPSSSSLKSETEQTKFRFRAIIIRSRRNRRTPRMTLGKKARSLSPLTGGFSCASPSRNDGGAVTVPSGRVDRSSARR